MPKHSSIGASSAHRWFECPGSVRLAASAPPQEETIYAKQGTAAHWVVEQYFKAWRADKHADLYDFVGKTAPNGYEITTEDVEAVEVFVDFVHDALKEGRFILHEEAQFELDAIYPGLFGTSDIVLMESNMKRLRVYDYKHGAGVPVEVIDNHQLLYYALGAIQYVCKKHKIDYLSVMGWGSTFKEVEIAVVQPRCRHKEGAIRRWIVPAETLDAFAVELAKKAKATADPKAALVVGDHCRFCPALAVCSAFNNKTFELAKADFRGVSDPSNLNLPAPETLSKHEIVKILNFADHVSEFIKRVEDHALHMLEHGETLPGYKLVKKRANRVWKNEEEARETLGLYVDPDKLDVKKFISPAQAEDLLKKDKKAIEHLIHKPEAGNTIAADHDPREAVPATAVSDFEGQ